jgi:hypothetical protein
LDPLPVNMLEALCHLLEVLPALGSIDIALFCAAEQAKGMPVEGKRGARPEKEISYLFQSVTV